MVAKGSIETASGISVSSTGVGAPVGAFLVVDGVSSIGMGTAAIIYSFSPGAGKQDDKSREIFESNIPKLMGKGLDIGANNEKPYFETGGEVFSSLVDLCTFKIPAKKAIDAGSNVFTLIQLGKTIEDISELFIPIPSPLNNEEESFEISKTLDKWRDGINKTGLWQP